MERFGVGWLLVVRAVILADAYYVDQISADLCHIRMGYDNVFKIGGAGHLAFCVFSYTINNYGARYIYTLGRLW